MSKRSPSKPILVIGSSNTDMIVRLPRIPGSGETLLGGEFVMAAGGKGANQAVAAARSGGKVAFIASLGKDRFGDDALAGFKREGIDVAHVVRDSKRPSGVALIFVSEKGENRIAVAGGSNGTLRPSHVVAARKRFEPGAWVVMQLETPLPTITMAAKLARKAGARVILNPAPAQTLPASLLGTVDLLTPNEHEAALLCGFPVTDDMSARAAAAHLRKLGVGGVIITLGARGAYVSVGQVEQLVPGFRVKAVDTTAAGDVFNGALAVALSEERTLIDAVRFAHAAAALSVTKLGAQPSIPTRRDIERLLKNSP
jgi:ribokinase